MIHTRISVHGIQLPGLFILDAESLCSRTRIWSTYINAITLILILSMGISDEIAPGVLHDYCEKDYFEPECPQGSIVVIEEARYGRMELGSCLTADFGYLNCYSNVVPVLDLWCSGRYRCRVLVSVLVEFRNACTEQLPSYLQARYTCETVIAPGENCCKTPGDKVLFTGRSGLISSHVTQSSGCGVTECPWFLKASPGQMINISLFDFGTYQTTQDVTHSGTRPEGRHRMCNIYAKIKEEVNGGSVTVCSGARRYRHLYTTVSNSVEIEIVDTGENEDEPAYFAIAFQVFGCSNPTAPDDSVLDRNGDHAIIICDSNNGRWEITCRDGEWHGDIGICSESGSGLGEEAKNSYFTREVYMVLVIAIAFVLAVAIVTTGIVCLYRHWSNIPLNRRGHQTHSSYLGSPDGTYLASEFNYSLPRQQKGYATIDYKYHSHDRNAQLDPRFVTNIARDRENDKGYYSDRNYESPICEHVQVTERDAVVS